MICDFCNSPMASASGFLGTKEVVTSKECSKLYLSSALAAGILVVHELRESLMSLVGQMASSDTPWALCADCTKNLKLAGPTPHVNPYELPAHGHALCQCPEPMVFVVLDDEAMMSAHKAAAAAVDEILRERFSDDGGSDEGEENELMEEVEDQPALAVSPVDDAERALAQMISRAEVEQRPTDYAAGAEECDYCHRSFDRCGLFVDGKLRGDSMWANMCASCFPKHGEGIGWGRGQIFARQANGDWRLVAGFPPG